MYIYIRTLCVCTATYCVAGLFRSGKFSCNHKYLNLFAGLLFVQCRCVPSPCMCKLSRAYQILTITKNAKISPCKKYGIVHVHVYHVLMLDLCVMRAKSLFVDKNSGLRIITSILHSSATRDPVAQW